jgi:thioredoxin 1
MANLIAVTDSTFEKEVLKADVPVLVDFWAVWCGPCRMVAPVVEAIAAEQEGKLKVVKLDVDANQDAATRYRVMSIPTLILFKNGQEAERLVGFRPKQAVMRDLSKHIA